MKTITNNTYSAIAVFAFGCSALSPKALAVNPAPDGGYAGGNTAEGANALFSLTSGIDNTASGLDALYKNTTGSYNTATGSKALFSNRTGHYNTATGDAALVFNTTGVSNTATGYAALYKNTTGGENTGTGVIALHDNTTGEGNTATGFAALHKNSIGFDNTANGNETLFSNSTGSNNTATGSVALTSNTAGHDNTANGFAALFSNTTGSNNTANGFEALYNNIGNGNIALGYKAGYNLTTGSNNIDIGYNVMALAGESNTIRIGDTNITNTYIRGISGATASGGVAVFVNGNGKLGTLTSSARFKREIKPMDKASEAILALRPVSFRYKKEIDPQGIPQFGLVAEEVEKVNPDLVIRDADGKPQTVRYDQVNAMLLNEFLKEHREVQELKRQVAVLSNGLQKVSAQLEVSRPAPQTVVSNR